MNDNPNFTDLNEAFGKALLQQFFEPVVAGRGPDGSVYTSPSGISIMVQELFKLHAHKIMDEVWEKLDTEVLATAVAAKVVEELTRVPGRYDSRNLLQDELAKRVKEIVAQQLGQRVVDQMDLRIGPKELSEQRESE